ncbi:MAG: elongation factor P maturation arginine rhamnosyltransferase EarP [Betaproteobacteria bacterium HGW-Betaproteobacteria-22]|nr:MAG: elongation factor P maturation arginine rhamnosyltransferase EarP [Betaproteobacteria bacterium HGW-Betaproteobacteria-22]
MQHQAIAKQARKWDIFCKIVDNFGDIGICWRLAKQLKTEHKLAIRLYIDDLNAAKKLIPTLDPTLQSQVIKEITITAWNANTTFTPKADVVIEAFACGLPSLYKAAMQPGIAWINLEYLSAETWVEDFHAKSATYGKLTRHFFFPGFTPNTGGLMREASYPTLVQNGTRADNLLSLSLFCYPHAPISTLLATLANGQKTTHCHVPATGILPEIAQFFNLDQVSAGNTYIKNKLHLHVLPFLSQDDYDTLLASCDINFVRGEDSWIRAIWAGKPFIWQPYLQSEDTHIIKLEAFLTAFYRGLDQSAQTAVRALHHAWQADATVHDNMQQHWGNYLQQLAAIQKHTLQHSSALAAHTDLATKLVIFSEKIT